MSVIVTTAQAHPIASAGGVLGLAVIIAGIAKMRRETRLADQTMAPPAPSSLDSWPSSKILLGVGLVILLATGLTSSGVIVVHHTEPPAATSHST